MAAPGDFVRDAKGKFTTKRKIGWRENVVIANKRRKRVLTESKESIVDGRRVVEIKVMAEEMWCTACDAPLSFRYVEDEIIIGLASIFYVRCHTCLLLHEVRTSRAGKNNNAARPGYAVNLKSALGIIDAGIGTTHLNTILSVLNIPTVSSTISKRNERRVGKKVEELAHESCREALRLEKALTLAALSIIFRCFILYLCSTNLIIQVEARSRTPPPYRRSLSRQSEPPGDVQQPDGLGQPTVKLKAAYDAGWQKKGSGRAYNSLTAHGIGIGPKSGKVLAFGTKNKRCIFCQKGHSPEDHDCRLNHTGSAKSMEAAIAVEIFAKNAMLKEEGVEIGTIIGDDDSSTIAQVRRESEHPVEKESDKNHAVCTLSKAMWALKIPSKVIDYIKYCFSCVLEKNKNNEEAVRTGLLNIVPHAFDDHSNCGSWCGYNKDPSKYTHRILPKGKGLTDQKMKATLPEVLQKFASNAKRLAPCGSTQGNESFHNISLSKTTKRCHYGGSESNDFRVASAVCQKNCGTSYVIAANTKLDLSPGKHTEKYRAQKDQMRTARALAAKTVEKKRRRRQLHQLRHHKTVNAENKEGITYSTGCGFDAVVDSIDCYAKRNDSIPGNAVVAFFDTETTGFSKSSEIVQLSARLGSQEFDAFIVPTQAFSPGASLVTGLSVREGELFRNGEKMKSTPRRLGMKSFIDFLTPGPVVLVAHNGDRFDAPLIVNEMRAAGLIEDFQSVVCGFSDTLPLLKRKLPERVKAKKSFSQSALAEDCVGSGASDGAHDSMVDVRVLENIVKSVCVTDEELRSQAVTVNSIIRTEVRVAQAKINRPGLDCLKEGVSAGMLTKMAMTGITIDHLQKSFSNGGESAITMLLGEDVNGRPRVTKNKKVLQNLIAQLKNCA